MRNRRTNIYAANQKSGKVYQDWVAGTAVKFINPQLEFQNATVTAIPGGNPSGTMKVPLAGTRISRVIAPLGGTRLQYAMNGENKCCDKGAGTFTEEIYKDNWSKSGVAGCCATKPTRALQPLIKSGLQYNESVRLGKYAFSYTQYRKNLRCLSYERSQEKFNNNSISPNFRKSGCNSCCMCCAREQKFKIVTNTVPTVGVKDDVTGIWTISQVIPGGAGWYWITVVRTTVAPCNGLVDGQQISFNSVIYTVVSPITLDFFTGGCSGVRGENITVYKPSNKKFAKQGAVSAGSRLERLKLDTLTASRLTKTQLEACGSDCEKLKVGSTTYNGGKVRFVTNGSKTAGFVPTRWRQSYLAHGRAIGNIFQRTTSNDAAGKTRSALPYQIGSIPGCAADIDCP